MKRIENKVMILERYIIENINIYIDVNDSCRNILRK